MTLLRDLHQALAENAIERAQAIGRQILAVQPPYPRSLIAYVEGLLSNAGPQRQDGMAPASGGPHPPTPVPRVAGPHEGPKAKPAAPDHPSVHEAANHSLTADITCIASSDLFDRAWYRSRYLADAPDTHNEVVHYCLTGWRLGYDPSPRFSTSLYLASNPDVKVAGCNPLAHYLTQGRREGRSGVQHEFGDTSLLQSQIDAQYVSWHAKRLDFIPIPHTSIAFYLPQFHTIPENDNWWGQGFTEWSNVRPARPLFPGHHQPHEPGELGYYDLSRLQTLERQVKIAKNYLVDAFCFYFYWFNGKTLLERPIQLFHSNPSIHFRFCLCWANENWTRRWDGLDEDILIAQSHSEADDLAFIAHISPYLRDKRYVRLSGRPLLIVYRPSLLPDPQATARRWRDHCAKAGIGDIYLAATQSFETNDPRTYGFDGAIEFAPNNMAPPRITDRVEGLPAEFQGHIYDWRGLVRRSESYPQAPYPVYRCVNPGWDNTPRKKLNSSILLHSSPREFQRWTVNAISDATQHFGEQGLLFVNAWNEWAEGAHLEPCQRYGYAYLEAFRQARVRAGVALHRMVDVRNEPDPLRVAIVIHAFYPDLLPEMFDLLQRVPELGRAKVVITTPYDRLSDCARRAEAYQAHIDPLVIGVENRGRDILPFFTAFEYVARAGYGIVCKLHTKKSPHREDGTTWRGRLLGSLLDPARVPEILDRLASDPSVGILGPDDHLLPMSTYWGSNRSTVLGLAARLGIEAKEVLALPLVAGSMFWAKTEALVPLFALVDPADFETESGQTDGTMAHAIERLFSVSAHSVGLRCLDASMRPFDSNLDVDFPFADKG